MQRPHSEAESNDKRKGVPVCDECACGEAGEAEDGLWMSRCVLRERNLQFFSAEGASLKWSLLIGEGQNPAKGLTRTRLEGDDRAGPAWLSERPGSPLPARALWLEPGSLALTPEDEWAGSVPPGDSHLLSALLQFRFRGVLGVSVCWELADNRCVWWC